MTSITDFVAFVISSSTVLPALSSFCVYAAFGILALYVLQVRGVNGKAAGKKRFCATLLRAHPRDVKS